MSIKTVLNNKSLVSQWWQSSLYGVTERLVCSQWRIQIDKIQQRYRFQEKHLTFNHSDKFSPL